MQPGDMIRKYRIEARLGAGAMGVVYKALDEQLHRTVVLKAIREELAFDASTRARFIDEARIQAKLIHQNICTLFDAFDENGKLYLLQEFVDGDTLRDMLARNGGPLPVNEALRIVRDILAGLEHAHEEGVIHRDIKPANIMVDKRGRVKIMDFGIAKALGATRLGKTQTGMAIGTLTYMSPEQILGKELDGRSDLYSVGILLFELLTGSLPFDDTSNEYEVQKFHVEAAVPSAADWHSDVTAECDECMQRALTKTPEERWQSAAEMRAAIVRILTGDVKKHTINDTTIMVPKNSVHTDAQEVAAKALGIPVERTLPKSGIVLRLIPAGEFLMGSPRSEPGRRKDELLHEVTLSTPFYISKCLVTQRQWCNVMDYNPSSFKGWFSNKKYNDHPVERVSWDECLTFLYKLEQLEKMDDDSLRLSTEAEWEYACRAGTQTPFYSGINFDSGKANFNGNHPYGNGRKAEYVCRTMPVGSYRPNAWGLYDMHGNVFEWCMDWYGPYDTSNAVDPRGPATGSQRVCRGGAYSSTAAMCRSARRAALDPDQRKTVLGLRIVMPVRIVS